MTDHAAYLRRGGVVLGVIGVAGFAADYLLNLGLTRLLPAHEYGDFRVASAFASLAGVAVLLGGDRAAPKALAGPLARGEAGAAWEYLRFYLQVGLGLSAVVIAGTWAASLLHVGPQHPDHHHPLAWIAPAIPASAVGALASRALQSARHPVLAALPWRVGMPLLTLALVGLAAVLGGGVGVHDAVLLGCLAVIAVAAWQWIELRRRELPRLGRDAAARAPRAWIRTSLPMMGAFLVALGLAQSDLYFLEILGQEHEVGHYAAAATVAHVLLLVQTTVVGLVAPLVQPAIEAGAAASRSAYRHGQRLMLVGLLPATAVAALGARPILALFGPDYTVVTVELELLVVANLAWALVALSVLWLQYRGRGAHVLAISLATLAADVALDVLLIPTYGVLGAAASTAATMSGAAVAVAVAHRRMGDPP